MEDKEVGQDGLVEIISSLPPTLSADDVDDFFTLAHHYAHKTPQSFRKVSLLTNVIISMAINLSIVDPMSKFLRFSESLEIDLSNDVF